MNTRSFLVIAAGVALAACQPTIPESGRGVGFDNQFNAERARRDAALSGVPAPASVTAAPLGSAAATAAETTRVLDATRPNGLGNDAATNSGVAPLNASPSNPPPVLNSAGISNENNFDAVSGQRSIDADAARLAANRSQYQVIQPEALPSREGSGPNVVAYALQTSHPRGTARYRRSGFNKQAKFERACAEFATADEAQLEFLLRGGPEKDRKGMDPDGDGYACRWDPAPYRRATQQG
ncbi:hypothetical protein HKX54_07725 [Sulfitobacter sp. M57]|uniref:hypothetical protein n=1 Tax=unclassified Sulfitobacter TaxID=196795 RepID=UPI0023E2B870|nr:MULTISPECIES: hypothetical protein [unclassified Sulfitobacter]MDF3414341.1 hypothetical protein [Sulfitobacter sp. KE5]MDF3420377.1 hypothetical protein [Sulfitobacter sp. KE43]MDF3432887.1 hypothetical protein [Sulfitobacter sp. KE42]MDF3458527.1 hypothetical protein [Sulfitobacter sp. S74]MDF3462427.1 hypothetical protein [Sulfitobacter sp. Ks18]